MHWEETGKESAPLKAHLVKGYATRMKRGDNLGDYSARGNTYILQL
jgi:hypothetical protein